METEDMGQRLHTEILMEDSTQKPYYGFDPNHLTLFIKSVPKFISRWDLKEILSKIPGFVSLSLSEPLRSQDYSRFGWILFETEENCDMALKSLTNLYVKDFGFTIVKSRTQKKPVKVETKLDSQRNEQDSILCRKLIQSLDEEKGFTTNKLLQDLENHPSQTFALDMQLLYLRKVHSYCYYCANVFAEERMLAAKCGPIHLRLQNDNESLISVPDWHSKAIEIVKDRIQKPQKYNFKNPTENIDEELDANLHKKLLKKVYDNRWPCLYCNKEFEEEQYILKHLKSKHEDLLTKLRISSVENLTYQNYVNDSNKLTPVNFVPNNNFVHSRNGPKRPMMHNNHRRGGGGNFRNFGERKNNFQAREFDDPMTIEEMMKNERKLINYKDI